MSEKSILLGLDGSAQSRYAAELAWSMAKAGNLRVDAQHVVDSMAAWDFLSFDIAGFIGSGPYFQAYESMQSTLSSIGRTLIDTYIATALQNGVESQGFLDEGSTIREICTRAGSYELVVMAHSSTGMESPDEDKRKIPRRSVSETLTHYCPKPLLLVGDRSQIWTKLHILLGPETMPTALLESCANFAKSLQIAPSVRYLQTKSATVKTEESLQKLNERLRKIPALSGADAQLCKADSANEYLRSDAQNASDSLLVVPVTEVGGMRTTAFGLAPDVVVRYLNHPAILFWFDGATSKSAAPVSSCSTAR